MPFTTATAIWRASTAAFSGSGTRSIRVRASATASNLHRKSLAGLFLADCFLRDNQFLRLPRPLPTAMAGDCTIRVFVDGLL